LPDDCVRALERADLTVHTGDFVSLALLVELETYGPLAAVHGNVDDPDVRALLPARRVVDVEGLRLGLVHDGGPAAGRHARLRRWFPDCDVVAYGHSHMPELARVDGMWILNPGSPTERRRAPFHSMIVVREGVPALVAL
jgi:uncharacterized protein